MIQSSCHTPQSPLIRYNTPEYLCLRRLHLSKSKLSNVAEMSSFMAGFSVAALIELQINDEDASPPLLTAYVITTALLVSTCMLSVMISTCILPYLQEVAKTIGISAPNRSPHDDMLLLIDISWILTNSASLFFFVMNMILMCWIKFTLFSRAASIAATVIMAPLLVIIPTSGFFFHRRIVRHHYEISCGTYDQLEKLRKQLQNGTRK